MCVDIVATPIVYVMRGVLFFSLLRLWHIWMQLYALLLTHSVLMCVSNSAGVLQTSFFILLYYGCQLMSRILLIP